MSDTDEPVGTAQDIIRRQTEIDAAKMALIERLEACIADARADLKALGVPPAEPKKQRGRPVGAKTRNRKDTNAPALPMPLRDTREGAAPRGAC